MLLFSFIVTSSWNENDNELLVVCEHAVSTPHKKVCDLAQHEPGEFYEGSGTDNPMISTEPPANPSPTRLKSFRGWRI